MDSGNWTQIVVELIRGLVRLALARKWKNHRHDDGGSGSSTT